MGSGGGPSIPAPPPPPDPMKAARANDVFYRSSLETYIQKQPDLAALETRLRERYQPRQRQLESELAALDSRRLAESQLQTERELGPQRSLEALRRQYELSPQAFALNRALGDQNMAAFARMYGASPSASVPLEVKNNSGVPPVDYLRGIPRIGVI